MTQESAELLERPNPDFHVKSTPMSKFSIVAFQGCREEIPELIPDEHHATQEATSP